MIGVRWANARPSTVTDRGLKWVQIEREERATEESVEFEEVEPRILGAGCQCGSSRVCPDFVLCPDFIKYMSSSCPDYVLVLFVTSVCPQNPIFVLIKSSF